MLISVIIPAYNAMSYLPETIESVQHQTIQTWELIIVNDGSKDETAHVAQQYADRDSRIRVMTQQNAGVSVARNAGFAATNPSAEFVCYLDADDTWYPDTLEILSQSLLTHPQAAGAYGLPCAIDSQSRPIRVGVLEAYFRDRRGIEGTRLVRWPADQPTTFACQVFENYIQTSGCLMLRRTAQELSGGFDARMNGCADWDMWLRLCRFGDLAFVDRAVLNYRMHENSMSKQGELMQNDMRFLRQKLFSWPDETPERRKLAIWGYRSTLIHSGNVRMQWAKECLLSGKLVQAFKQFSLAIEPYWRYASGSVPIRRISE